MEQRLVRAAAFDGLDQDTPGVVQKRVWPLVRVLSVAVAVGMFCLPGTVVGIMSIYSLIAVGSMPAQAVFAFVLGAAFGFGWAAISVVLCGCRFRASHVLTNDAADGHRLAFTFCGALASAGARPCPAANLVSRSISQCAV